MLESSEKQSGAQSCMIESQCSSRSSPEKAIASLEKYVKNHQSDIKKEIPEVTNAGKNNRSQGPVAKGIVDAIIGGRKGKADHNSSSNSKPLPKGSRQNTENLERDEPRRREGKATSDQASTSPERPQSPRHHDRHSKAHPSTSQHPSQHPQPPAGTPVGSCEEKADQKLSQYSQPPTGVDYNQREGKAGQHPFQYSQPPVEMQRIQGEIWLRAPTGDVAMHYSQQNQADQLSEGSGEGDENSDGDYGSDGSDSGGENGSDRGRDGECDDGSNSGNDKNVYGKNHMSDHVLRSYTGEGYGDVDQYNEDRLYDNSGNHGSEGNSGWQGDGQHQDGHANAPLDGDSRMNGKHEIHNNMQP
ncbi:hypothetical protein P154DRAFT_538080 [Amniculicola lignicola CBS 123094]|uniref:Uncharacterized protein n=1 Tax=Amniculicola lignicola CBS 123094 TaxID=1392246 RepID=A0A6A5W3A9_9PLEO|nr:hypothetical protein P154DRAFT_538080 [Amniculicola lignicola CBS 123094]